jgi:hypothetical protein
MHKWVVIRRIAPTTDHDRWLDLKPTSALVGLSLCHMQQCFHLHGIGTYSEVSKIGCWDANNSFILASNLVQFQTWGPSHLHWGPWSLWCRFWVAAKQPGTREGPQLKMNIQLGDIEIYLGGWKPAQLRHVQRCTDQQQCSAEQALVLLNLSNDDVDDGLKFELSDRPGAFLIINAVGAISSLHNVWLIFAEI